MTAAQSLVRAAQAEGVLAPDVAGAIELSPSWAIAALSFLGALLVALFGVLLLGLVWGDALLRPPVAWTVALVLAVAGVALLRGAPGMFRTQLAFSVLLVAQGAWALGWSGRGGPWSGLGAVAPALLALQLVLAWAIPVSWVTRWLGFLAAGSGMGWGLLWAPPRRWLDDLGQALPLRMQAAIWALALAWALWCVCERRASTRAWAPRAGALADGAAVALLLAPLLWSLPGWFLGARLLTGSEAQLAASGLWALNAVVGVRLVLVAGVSWWLLRRHWPRSGAAGAAWPQLALMQALWLVACGWLAVEVVALVATVALATGRRRLWALALALALWQLAQFYYLLRWSLVDKALLLAACGLALAGALALLHRRGPQARPAAAQPRWRPALLLAGALLALGLVQWDVRQKDRVIAHGQKVFVQLQPVDPRSLMQGDYMALRFDLGPVRAALEQDPGMAMTRPVVARLDARQVATLLRLAQSGEVLAPGELLLPLKRLQGQWTLVTDAFFFPEGQGRVLGGARYGEFRALPGGRALLVGLADARLQPIHPAPDQPLSGDAESAPSPPPPAAE